MQAAHFTASAASRMAYSEDGLSMRRTFAKLRAFHHGFLMNQRSMALPLSAAVRLSRGIQKFLIMRGLKDLPPSKAALFLNRLN